MRNLSGLKENDEAILTHWGRSVARGVVSKVTPTQVEIHGRKFNMDGTLRGRDNPLIVTVSGQPQVVTGAAPSTSAGLEAVRENEAMLYEKGFLLSERGQYYGLSSEVDRRLRGLDKASITALNRAIEKIVRPHKNLALQEHTDRESGETFFYVDRLSDLALLPDAARGSVLASVLDFVSECQDNLEHQDFILGSAAIRVKVHTGEGETTYTCTWGEA